MIEYRTVKGSATASGGSLTGLVTPFNVETTIGDLKSGGFREQIAPGAFKKTLQERDVVLLFNHNTDMPLARTSVPDGPGSLTLREDPKAGLRADSTPVQTSYGKDLMALTRSGVVKGMSFGFEVIKDSWTDDEGRASNSMVGTHRTVQEVRLHEVSAVTFPAYESTSLSARDAIRAARGSERRSDSDESDGMATCIGCDEPVSMDDSECSNCGRVLDESDTDGRRAADPKKPYGDVAYADPKNGKYPIDTEAHAKAAWAYINMPKNAAVYPLNGVSLASVKAKIEAALKKFGVKVSEQNSMKLAVEWEELIESYEVDRRDADMPENPEVDQDSPLAHMLQGIDASLDAAFVELGDIDRNSLPEQVNQFIDLVTAAHLIAGKALHETDIPDPDNPMNDAEYEESDESERAEFVPEAEYADLYAAWHERIRFDLEF